jgi:hypothetical protein
MALLLLLLLLLLLVLLLLLGYGAILIYTEYDGSENIEKRSRALEVTLDSSTDINLGHNHTAI